MSILRKQIARWSIRMKNSHSWQYMNMGYNLFQGSRAELLHYQDNKYQKLLLYAYEHTPYYHKVFDEIGLIKDGKIKKEHYTDIPVLDKQIITREGKNLISDEAQVRGAYQNTSGGSTGNPVEFIQDKEYFSCNFGDQMLYGVLNGKFPGEKELKIWGSERDILTGTIGLKEKCINFCYNRTFLNSFVLTPEQMGKYIETINKEKPKQIWTYADSIYELAKYAEENHISVYSPKNIVTTAGVLYEDMRTQIQCVFKDSNILNQYGSREVGLIGCEIGKKRGIRIFDHSKRVEVMELGSGIIKEQGEGELLVTNLNNYSMPLIRYKIGDTGEVSRDINGFSGSFSVLKKLTGRTNTHLQKKDGSLVHGEYVTHLFYNKKWIQNFRVIQHGYQEIEFQIVLKEGCHENSEDLNRMKSDLCKVIDGCKVTVTYMEQIPRLKSGKYQFVISELRNTINKPADEECMDL